MKEHNITSNEFCNKHFNISKETLMSMDRGSDDAASVSERPPSYNIVLSDVNNVPQDFLQLTLRIFFNKTNHQIEAILANVKINSYNIICGNYSKDCAETKNMHLQEFAEKNNFTIESMLISNV